MIFINTDVSNDVNSYSVDNIVENNSSNSTNRFLRIILFFCLIVLVILLIFSLFLIFENYDKKNRTIMIYMVGSDLESENKIATYDLEDINPENIDLENMNVVLMVGGSVKWHNYVSEDEVAIYELTSSGFEKSISYDLSSMGESKSLVKFFDYVSSNYNSKLYDLIFWNHGIGAYGIESDEIYDDYLTITELSESMTKSPFNVDNKLNSVLFINCLSANLHFAQVMKDYANYMIASEEISYGNSILDKLNFIETIEKDDDGYEYGVKFIENFSHSVESYNDRSYKNIDSTYSIIDLSKVSNVVDGLNSLVSYVDVFDNYKKIAKLRGNIVTYGKELSIYDTVDLYALVYGFKDIAPSDMVSELLMDIKNAVVYNWSLNGYSYGISVYFPYHGSNSYVNLHFDELKEISNDEYLSFVETFHSIKSSNTTNLNFSKNFGVTDSGVFNFVLEDEQIEDFSKASVVILKDTKDGYFVPMYTSDDTVLSSNGILKFNYKGKALKVIDKNDGSSFNLYLSEKEKNESYAEYLTFALLQDTLGKSVPVEIYIVVDDSNPNGYISKVVKSDDILPSMVILDLNDYSDMFFTNSKYDIFDDFGNYTENWQSEGTSYMFRVGTSLSDYEFEVVDLNEKGNDYYCVFKIYDLNNKVYYSNIIPIE